MDVTVATAKSILTPQAGGLLASPPYPFTHSLSPYTGCAFGATTCGLCCYAQFLPNWVHSSEGAAWGGAVRVKENAPALLDAALGALSPRGGASCASSWPPPPTPTSRSRRATASRAAAWRSSRGTTTWTC